MGASKGVVRRLPVAPHLVYDYIPIDVVVNQLLVTAWHVHRQRYTIICVIKRDDQKVIEIPFFL